jgi:hypothetical protein
MIAATVAAFVGVTLAGYSLVAVSEAGAARGWWPA